MPFPAASVAKPTGKRPVPGTLMFLAVLSHATRAPTVSTAALALALLASLTRVMRASMLEVTTQDYVKTARAKGLGEGRVVFFHQIRNALVPIVTMLGPMVASVLMGTFVIEKIFAIPGLGQHFVNSITGLDYTVTLGLTIFYGAFLVAANFLVDIAYGLVDPRIRIAK